MTTKNPDDVINALFAKLQEKKKAIEAIEKPNFKTNLTFGYNPENPTRINIHTVTDTDVLIRMLGFLMKEAELHNLAAEKLELKSTFKWQGFTLEDWMHDIKARVGKINIDAKRKEFKQLEDKLNSLVSPEQRRLMEIEAITKALE